VPRLSWRERRTWDSSLQRQRWILWPSVRGQRGLGSDTRVRDVVGHVKGEMTAYTPQAGYSPGRIVRCGSEQRNRTCGEEKGSEYEAPD
jgi:hypothetical protein